MIKFFWIVCFFLFTSISFGQTIIFEGNVTDEINQLPLEAATVYVSNAKDATLIEYTITDKKGKFYLNLKKKEVPVILKISMAGFEDYILDLKSIHKAIDFGRIVLKVESKMLGEVVVKSQAPPIRFKKDTLEFNAASFKVRPDANVQTLLKQLPGVDVDADGKITVNGKEVNKILVNGKPFFDKDGKVALQNLPAEIINKVQVTDTKTKKEELSHQSASSNNASINLTIDEEKNKGYFGKFTGGYGSSGRYEILNQQNTITSDLSNLSLQLYSIMLKSGYVKSDKDMFRISKFFHKNLPEYKYKDLGFREKLWLYKAHLWHGFLIQDFLSCFKYSKKWVDLFYENEQMIYLNPVWYIKGNTYLLESLFLIKHKSYFKERLEKLEHTLNSDAFPKNDNLDSLGFLCLYASKFNFHFLEGDFKGGIPLVDEVLHKLKKHQERIDEHHIMVLYYKIACLYFGNGNNSECIHYLKKIIDNKSLTMREDLMCFSRILSLIAHFEEGLDYQLELQIKNTYSFLIKMNELHGVQREIIKFLKNIGTSYPQQLKSEFLKLHDRLQIYESHPYEKRAFLYLDITSWLESKIENKPVAVIIQEKAKRKLR